MTRLYHPEQFQGRGKKHTYFEGWYYKLVSSSESSAYAIIPGVSLSRDKNKSHAFIMVVDARHHKMHYAQYPINEFWASKKDFVITIGPNQFSRERLELNIDNDKSKISANLQFKNIFPWPVNWYSPGTMGPYAFIPWMECYHATLSFDHRISGKMTINQRTVNLTDGKGYLEKDWGRSMPSAWIWMQTNHFDEDGVSLFGSVARIPWLGRSFTGYIFGLLHKNTLYRFTTYNGARIEHLSVDEKSISLTIATKKYALEISAERAAGIDLPAPKLGDMSAKVNESLRARIHVSLVNRQSQREIFSGTGRNAGLEFVGDIDQLLHGLKLR
ncbi:hypothetical protein KBC99_00930 [Candidatus Saccharibacteria bacterium]|nr:hypothetical protein [Candidatus Saccharibacteria bacterium]